MKKIIFHLLILLAFSNCDNASTSNTSKEENTKITPVVEEQTSPPLMEKDIQQITGLYEGYLTNEITRNGSLKTEVDDIQLTIDKIVGDTFSGHYETSEGKRPFEGTLEKSNKKYYGSFYELGDSRDLGSAFLEFDIAANELVIKWEANDESFPIIERNYELEKTAGLHNPNDVSTIYGYYVGYFYSVEYKSNEKPSHSNKITLSIDSLIDGQAFGHSVVAGNARPFSGRYQQEIGKITFEVNEPGDDRYDGRFEFTADNDGQQIEGHWYANDSRLAVTSRMYKLDRKAFRYNPDVMLTENILHDGLYDSYNQKTDQEEGLTDDVLKVNASNQLLTKSDVGNLYQADLEVIRNTIYARHGYSFKNRRMRYVFDNYVDWYMPLKTNILADLTDIEKQNIDLLKRYENHAEKYYDYFGR
ncbi:MAG: YARHG domain-containing protein [Bacteroidota bacterium]